MTQKTKIIYVGILHNIKINAYANNKDLLKKDLSTLQRLLLIDKENENMKKIAKNMQKVLTLAS